MARIPVSDLTALIDTLSSASVLVIGDVMLDRYTYGTVERVSPEAPIPVLRATREAAMLGGAGNVACNLVALGARVSLLSVVGDDAPGSELLRLAGDQLSGVVDLIREPGRETSVKTRFLSGAQHLLRVDRESLGPISPGAADRLVRTADRLLKDCAVLVLSDYDKGVLAPDVVRRLIARARALGRPVLVDPKGRDWSRYAGAALITPNRKELAEASGLTVKSDREIEAACERVIDATGIPSIVATRSEDGMSVVTGREGGLSVTHLKAEAREVYDVSGAGDTVMAALAGAMAAGADLVMAARLANVAAGIVVGKVGTATVRPEELRAAIHRLDWERSEAKVAGLDAAMERIARWRLRGQSVGFTNGCFDLLHPGHVSLLRQAKAACDRLVVGLNSDASVKRLKGESRPVQSEAARSTVLASLADVDLVLIFEEDTPLRLIEAIQPDVLVKGADYSLDKVVGADLVVKNGGRVLLADLVQGHSTTGTIGRMAASRD